MTAYEWRISDLSSDICSSDLKQIIKPEMLFERVIEVDERVRADGTIEKAPDLSAVRAELEVARRDGIKAVAIVFMNDYRYTEHEQKVAVLPREPEFARSEERRVGKERVSSFRYRWDP